MTELKMTRGDTFIFNTVISDNSGPVNLTGGLLIFTLKRKYSDTDLQAVAQKKSPSDGITITTPLSGQAKITLSPSDTSSLAAVSVRLVWDLQLVMSGAVFTVNSGTMTVSPDVTVSTS